MTHSFFSGKEAWVVLAIALPWLNPFATGPSPPVVQSLVSLSGGAVLLALAWRFRAHDLARLAAAAWLAAAMLSCVIGLLQYFGLSEQLSPWVNNTAPGEAFANLRQRNQFATLANIGLVALLWWIQMGLAPGVVPILDNGLADETGQPSPGSGGSVLRGGRRFAQFGSLGAAAVLAVGNAASSSRTGMLQLVLVAGLLLVWGRLRQPRVRRVVLVAGLSYACAAFALPRLAGLDPSISGILARLHEAGPACASRFVLWHNVLQLISLHPWAGWGWGELDYAHFMTLYAGPRFCDILDNAHNLPLHLAVELGVPVALLACGLGLWLLWRTRPWRERDAARQLAWSVLALILLHSMLEYPLWYGPFQVAAGLSLWLLWSSRPALGAGPVGGGRPGDRAAGLAAGFARRRTVTMSAAVVLLVCVSYAAWDYYRVSQIYLASGERAPAYRENTLEKIRGSWLFRNQVRFAELGTTELGSDNAAQVNTMAHELLHFSPEARVAEKLIESAVKLGRDDEALLMLARYRAAFPVDHARWVKTIQWASAAPAPGD